MTQTFHLRPATALHADMGEFQAEAASEGFRFIDKLMGDWLSAANRFDRPGELFLGAFQEGRLLGICGLNHDPYTDQDGIGRLRHLYVRQDARRNGIASALVERILGEAEGVFQLVRLRTDSREAAEFYTRLGFTPVNDATASHVLPLPYQVQNS
jgi:GNAT superfamily N-acetyltransferase